MAPLPLVSLCTGGGRLDDGARAALRRYGVLARPVLYVEREAWAGAYLVGEMAEGRMDEAPVWSDLGLLGFEELDRVLELAGPVVVTAGFPCTPWSSAGQRRGTEDERWIWDDIARILRHLEPGLVVLECTPGVTSGGVEHVFGTLADLGLDAESFVLRASDVGASQRRARWWCVGISERFRKLLGDAEGNGGGRGESPGAERQLADAQGERRDAETEPARRARGRGSEGRSAGLGGGGGLVADADSGGRPGQRGSDGDGRQDSRGDELDGRGPCFPPGPGDDEAWTRILAARPELAPALTRADEPAAIRALRGVAHGLVAAERRDLLRLFGNGVVPQCAERAIDELLRRLMEG